MATAQMPAPIRTARSAFSSNDIADRGRFGLDLLRHWPEVPDHVVDRVLDRSLGPPPDHVSDRAGVGYTAIQVFEARLVGDVERHVAEARRRSGALDHHPGQVDDPD